MINGEETLSVSGVMDQVIPVGEQRGQAACVNRAPDET